MRAVLRWKPARRVLYSTGTRDSTVDVRTAQTRAMPWYSSSGGRTAGLGPGVTWWGSRSCPSRASGRTGSPGYAMVLVGGNGGLGAGENRCDMVGEPFLSFESLRTNGRPRPGLYQVFAGLRTNGRPRRRLCNGLGGREWWFGRGGKQVRHGGGAVPVLREPQDERGSQAQAMRWCWWAGMVVWGRGKTGETWWGSRSCPSRASGRTGSPGPGCAMVFEPGRSNGRLRPR